MSVTPAPLPVPGGEVAALHRELDVAWARINELGELLRSHNIDAGALTPHLDHLAMLSTRASADARTGETMRATMRTIAADASRDLDCGADPATILKITSNAYPVSTSKAPNRFAATPARRPPTLCAAARKSRSYFPAIRSARNPPTCRPSNSASGARRTECRATETRMSR